MDDATTLLNEMRRINTDFLAAEAEEAAIEARIKQIKERRHLLEETWQLMWSNDNMSLIQAKMMAHDVLEEKRRRNYFRWVPESQRSRSRWTHVLRWLYVKLGGED